MSKSLCKVLSDLWIKFKEAKRNEAKQGEWALKTTNLYKTYDLYQLEINHLYHHIIAELGALVYVMWSWDMNKEGCVL